MSKLASGRWLLAAGFWSQVIDRLFEGYSFQIPELYVYRTKCINLNSVDRLSGKNFTMFETSSLKDSQLYKNLHDCIENFR
jgi:hypothetical protein